MVFDGARSDRLGTAWVLPALRDASSVQDLIAEARHLAAAEGMSSTCTSWATIGLWSRPEHLSEGDIAAWRDAIVTDPSAQERLCARCPISRENVIRLPWPSFADDATGREFDVLLAALTEPRVHGEPALDAPSSDEIVQRMSLDGSEKGFEYFSRNRAVEISTFQDLAIIESIGRDPRLSKLPRPDELDGELWRYVEGFIGYGSARPRFVFVGLEERTDPGDEAQNLARRISRPDIFGGARGDKNLALQALYPGRRIDAVAQWKVSAAIVAEVRRMLGERPSDDELLALGTPAADSFLAELLPVPRSGGSRFPVEKFAFKFEAAYRRAALGRDSTGVGLRGAQVSTFRWNALRHLLRGDASNAPEFVVCYGTGWRLVFEQLAGPWSGLPRQDLERGKVWRLARNDRNSAIAVTGFFRERQRNPTDVTPDDATAIARGLVEIVQQQD